MITHDKLLTTAAEIQDLATQLRKKDVIAFDTEFIRENTFYPIVEIIQVATDSESWLVDARAFKKGFGQGPKGGFDAGLQPLLDVFTDKSILKVLHAAQGDQECIFTSFGVVASPVIDTAVAASFSGMGEGLGLGKLLKSVLDVTIKKGHARTNWSVRPLPEQLIEYAHADVVHLVELGCRLLERVEKLGRRDWAMENSAKFEDSSLYEPDPLEMAMRLARGGRLDKRGVPALIELMKWREARVRQLNLPRRWVADDAVLLDLANVRPKDIEHLGAFRGLNKGELKHSGEQILAALHQKSESVEVRLPPRERTEAPSTEEGQALDLLKCYVGILADRHRIAARHLMTAAQLQALLRSDCSTPAELVEAGALSPEAAKLAGEEILAFIQGKRALSVCFTRSSARVQIVSVKGDPE